MGRTAQEELQIQHRRRQITERYLKGWTQAAIAGELAVSQATVSSDLTVIRREWRDSRIRVRRFPCSWCSSVLPTGSARGAGR